MYDVLWTLFWVLMILYVSNFQLNTEYSKREQQWTMEVMISLSAQQAGFALHKALHIGNRDLNSLRNKCVMWIFIMYYSTLVSYQFKIFSRGLYLTSDLQNTGTPNGQAENDLIHEFRVVFLIYGIIFLTILTVFFFMVLCTFMILF